MADITLELDHATILLPDLGPAVTRFERAHGLKALEEILPFPPSAVAARVVPLGDQYIELMAIVDDDAVHSDPTGFSTWVAARRDAGGGPLMFAARTSDIESHASRLGLPLVPLSATRARGRVAWSLLGLLEAPASGAVYLPFFISTDNPFTAHHRAQAPRAGHDLASTGIARVNVSGDCDRLRSWTDGAALDVECSPGDAAIDSIVISTETGEYILEC